ncbi:MAG: hypothetical protein Q4D62_03230 [Planctomycetia bacterium]|nr:hypothetical protein [Planctomycetia bacterium]
MRFSSFFSMLFLTLPLAAGEWRPVQVWTEAETFSPTFSVEKMIDQDLGTYACILDDSRDGTNENVCPPKAKAPVTALFVLDLGETRKVRGLRMVARNNWVWTMPQNVSVFACDDLQGKENRRWLKERVEIPGMGCSHSAFVLWEPEVETRYLGVRVNDSFQKNWQYHWKWQQLEWSRRLGLATFGDGKNFNIQIAEITCFDNLPDDYLPKNPPELAFPQYRLRRDWMYQDGGLDISRWFRSPNDAEYENRMVEKVLAELREKGADVTSLENRRKELLAKKVPGQAEDWEKLYFEACEKRREFRLQPILAKTRQFIYVKHYIFGSTNGLIGKYDIPDEQIRDITMSYQPGSQLCLLTVREDGSFQHEVLLEKPQGVICYPTLSYDAKTLVFSMRDNFETDSYYLYTMDMATRNVRQITFPLKKEGKVLPVADCEPVFLPNGKIVFTSTRSVRISDCWYRASGDIYVCDADGSNIERLTADQLHSHHPQVLEDGRIVFTRWEYNDRTALYLHPLISMNPDGTVQTEYYGNNSMFPSSIIHTQRIPGSSKLLAIISGHHTIYKGKLGLLDRNRGTQAGEGITLVNTKLDGSPGMEEPNVIPSGFNDFMVDIFGQVGPQYAHPFALDEENYLCSFSPEGTLLTFGKLNPPMGAYFMTADGKRELLAFDQWQGTGRIIPVMPMSVPPDRGNHLVMEDNFGTFYLQNVYFGPGLEGIPHGTAKKLRVVALEYRVARMGYGQNGGECETGLCQTPISLNSGSWDVKHVLGEVDIEEDGSCYFQVPARTPVYFQILDENGYCIQSMRSWATLMNGEQFACLGCHENKNDALPPSQRKPTLAMRKPPQIPRQVTGKLHPLVERLQKESWKDRVENYLGVNVARSLDADAPVEGFSYVQEIQPIFDKHCVSCHCEEKLSETKLCLTGEVARPETIRLIGAGHVDPKRAYTRSYVEITTSGNPDGNPWMQWLKPRSRAVMLPPYHTGSCKSKIMAYLEPSHYDVRVSDAEKRTLACWLDLLIPFCGSYTQNNTWTDAEKQEYQYFQDKRMIYAVDEWETLKKR